MSRWKTVALALPVPILLVAVWHVAARTGLVANLPVPGEVAEQLVRLLGGTRVFSATLAMHVLESTARVAIGFGAACLVAIPLGVLMGRSERLSALIDPTVNLFRPLPVTAWAPLMVVIIGIGSTSAVVLIFIAAFFPVLVNTVAGVRSTPTRLLEAAAMLGTRQAGVLWRIVLPSAVPQVFAGMRIGLGIAWVVVVVGETVGVQVGIGALIIQAWQVSRTDLIIAGMVVIGVAGFLSDIGMSRLVRASLRGRPMLGT
jgi:NitT/TauT family transport system permease protein